MGMPRYKDGKIYCSKCERYLTSDNFNKNSAKKMGYKVFAINTKTFIQNLPHILKQ